MTTRRKPPTRDKRIKKEIKRLNKIFSELDQDMHDVVEGLIKRAAFMRVTLEDYEEDINLNGSVEQFSQSDKLEPYERGRPVVGFYNTMNKNYQSITKQLSDLLPDTVPVDSVMVTFDKPK